MIIIMAVAVISWLLLEMAPETKQPNSKQAKLQQNTNAPRGIIIIFCF